MNKTKHIHVLKNGKLLLIKLIDGLKMTIGNGRDTDIRISHCKYDICATLTTTESQVMLIPERQGSVFVNDISISEPHFIHTEDCVKIDDYQFKLEDDYQSNHTATLTDKHGKIMDKCILPTITFLGDISTSFKQLSISVGRSSMCDYIIPGDTKKSMGVSREHAEIFCAGGRYFIRDMNSKAGIKINRKSVSSMPLPEEGTIYLGEYTIPYKISDNDNAYNADTIDIPAIDNNLPCKKFVGQSEEFRKLIAQLDQIKQTDQSVFLCGETGTGKGLCARYLHFYNKKRNKHPFILVNCAAISHQLAESQLFGHVKGSFTGATTDHIGFFEQAHQGTLFLDEFTELPLDMQAKMLHVLEESIVRKIGSKSNTFVDVRIIFATNQDVQHLISEKKFRKDLFYRCNKTIHIPAIRERRDDIPVLINHFLKDAPYTISIHKSAMDRLMQYNWPGNTRELASCISNAIMNASFKQSYFINVDDLELPESIPVYPSCTPKIEKNRSMSDRIKSFLAKYKGNVNKASKDLDVSRGTLYNKMQKFDINPDDFRD